jgi:hypothetical protein
MKGMKRGRWVAAATMVTAATLAFSARPALAADLGDSSTWAYLGPSAMSCAIGPATLTTGWSCDTPSAPIVAAGSDCIQTLNVDNARGVAVSVPLTGCTASLFIPPGGWQGPYDCNLGVPVGAGCTGAMAAGLGFFSFQPVLGSSFDQELATITDAACTKEGGHATVTSSGFDGSHVFSMQGTLNWVGNCSHVNELTWTGSFTVS